MATTLHAVVVRECMNTSEQGRPIIVAMEPGDTLSFRPKGCRKLWRTTLGACFHMAVKAEVREQQRIKEQARKERRRAR
jgi:hypothetical protein